MVVDKKQTAVGVVADLSHKGEGKVFVKPADYDAFLMTQREAVEALRDHKKMASWLEKLKDQIDNLLTDIAAWGKAQGVAQVVWGPRRDEGFFAVVARDEDEAFKLQDAMATLEMELREKYNFRLSFLMLRASEAEGIDSFVLPSTARTIFPASASSPPRKG